MRTALRLVLVAVLALTFLPPATAQDGENSTRKIRAEPSAMAAKAGQAIQWRASIDEAIAEAARTDKPVFWYVPSVAGTFMDRKVEVDRYMLAGPFSWPRTIELLNAAYVPVRAETTKELNERFGLERVEFIEPGYLVLAADGSEAWRVDQITTFHPRQFLQPLESFVGRTPIDSNLPGSVTVERLKSFPSGAALAQALESGTRVERVAMRAAIGGEIVPELLFLFGVQAHQAGNDAWGRELWTELMAKHPDHPLAHKVAMELEGHGPFLRGFEVYGPLKASVLAQPGRGTQSASAFEAAEVWRAGIQFLRGLQNDAGGFEDSYYDFGGTDGLPNVHVAVSAVCGIALEHASHQSEPARAAFDLARRYLLDDANLNPSDSDEQIWAHLYRLRFLAACMDGDLEAKSWALAPAQRIAGQLVGMQGEGGPWYHEYPNPFVTASCLVALHDVKRHGVTVDRAVVDSALDALETCRTADGAFTYGMPRREARAAVEASVARGPLCELALVQWGRSSQERLLAAIQASFEHEDPLFKVRKYDDHTRFHAYGGFFFWYGLRGRAEAIANLEDAGARRRLASKAREQILALPEFDGCFVDSHEIGRAYGTGMALWSLDVLSEL
jgi:hypothetical protein